MNIGAIRLDEPLLADKEVLFYGQAVAAILADSHEIARKAASMVSVEIEELEPIITIDQAMSKKSFLEEPIKMSTGNAKGAIIKATNSIGGEFYVGGQEHYYLESQSALAIPTENGELLVHSSTQNPSEVQHLLAHVLNIPQHCIEVATRRMGGAVL